jgi:hypothetical protein
MELLCSGVVSAGQVALSDALSPYLDELPGLVARCGDADLIAEVRELEVLRRRLTAADHLLIAALEQRGIAGLVGPSTTSELLQDVLRLSPREANARVGAAAALGPRVGLTGEALGPLRPATAEASADGLLSSEHVGVICRALKELPSELPVAEVDGLEGTLVEAALSLPPSELVKVGTRMKDTFKPDGAQPSEDEARKLRFLTARVCPDGMVEGKFRLSPEAGAVVLGVLHSQAAPLPADDGTPDPRSYHQRMADALEDLARLGLRAGSITPHGRGVALNLTMSREQFETNKGLVETSFGQLLTVDTALELAREASIALIVQAANGAIMDYGHARRYATRAQARALAARDHGCSFPGLPQAGRMGRPPPCSPVAGRRHHRPQQSDAALRAASPRIRTQGLGLPDDRRPALVGPPEMDRPRAETQTEHPNNQAALKAASDDPTTNALPAFRCHACGFAYAVDAALSRCGSPAGLRRGRPAAVRSA